MQALENPYSPCGVVSLLEVEENSQYHVVGRESLTDVMVQPEKGLLRGAMSTKSKLMVRESV
jgi:hypothetical protein